MLLFVFIFSIGTISSQETLQFQDIFAKENNFFHKINEQIHLIVNKLFSELKIRNELKNSIKNQQLTSMHVFLNKIIEHNYYTFNQINDVIKNGNESKDTETKTVRLLNEVLKDFELNTKKKTNESQTLNETNYNSNETMEVLSEFIKKIDSLTVDDFLEEESDKVVNKDETKNESSVNFKAWHPNSNRTSFRRIFNGNESSINTYPFMASVHMLKQFVCGGSIISINFVITAASCLQIAYYNRYYRKNPRDIFVRIGSDHTNRHGVTIPVSELIFHPEYDPVTLKNNLLILRMKKRIKIKNKKIRRIEYDRQRSILSDVGVTILGWGSTDFLDNDETHTLTAAHVDVYNLRDCKNIYSEYYVTDFHFCAGYISKGSGACNRDVGGPGVVNGILTGIISFGSPVCGANDSPTVFIKLGYYADWIDSIIKSNTTSRRSLNSVRKENKIKHKHQKQNLRNQATSDDIEILRDVLRNLLTLNNSLLEDILYGDFNDGYHEVFNKSLTHAPTKNLFENRTLFSSISTYITKPKPKPIVLTTSTHTTPINHPHNVILDPEAPYRWKTRTGPTPHPIVTYSEHIKIFTLQDKFGRVGNDQAKDSVSDNYEDNDGHKGMSIEVRFTKLNEDKIEIVNSEETTKPMKRKKHRKKQRIIQHNVEREKMKSSSKRNNIRVTQMFL